MKEGDNLPTYFPRSNFVIRATLTLIGIHCVFAFQCGAARAANQAPVSIADIRVGFGGHYKLGRWTPVDVLLSAGGAGVQGDVEVVVPDGDGVPTRVVERGVALKANEKTWTRLYVMFGRPHAAIAVTFRSTEGAVLAERTFSGDEVPVALGAASKSGTAKLVLELGSRIDLGSSIRFSDEGEPEETAVAYVDDPTQLPSRSDGYDGVDLIVMTTGKPEFYRRLSPEALDALDQWLHLGWANADLCRPKWTGTSECRKTTGTLRARPIREDHFDPPLRGLGELRRDAGRADQSGGGQRERPVRHGCRAAAGRSRPRRGFIW